MDKIKITIIAVTCAFIGGVSGILGQNIFNKSIGYINDVDVIKNCPQAIALKKQQEAGVSELKKLTIDAQNKLSSAKTKQEQKKLEKTLTLQFNKRKQELDEAYKTTFVSLQNNLKDSVKNVANKRNLSVVFSKINIIHGGVDVTQDVINDLKINQPEQSKKVSSNANN